MRLSGHAASANTAWPSAQEMLATCTSSAHGYEGMDFLNCISVVTLLNRICWDTAGTNNLALHGLNTLQHHSSKGIRHLGSCMIFVSTV